MADRFVRGGERLVVKPKPVSDVSVLVPLYNHERYIRAALSSVLCQTAAPREIVCIDDGSTDGSAGVVSELAGRFDLIRFSSRPNRGAAATLNEAAQAATGSILSILNSDDVYLPHRLARAAAVLAADKRVAAVASDVVCIDEYGDQFEDPWQNEATAYYRKVGDLGVALINGNFLRTTSNLVVRRSVFEELGGFDDLRYAHDLHFFLRLAASGQRMAILKDKLLCYRLHSSNTIAEAHLGVRTEWAAVAAFHVRDLLRQPGPQARDQLKIVFGVLEKHGLRRAVEGLLPSIQLVNGPTLGPSALLKDQVLRRRLADEVAVGANR